MGCKVKELRFGLHKCRTPVYYLFSCGYPKEMIKELMTQNLRGEISI